MPKEKAMESVEQLREREGNFIALLLRLCHALGHCAVQNKRSPLLISRNAVTHVLATDGSHRTPAARSHGELVAESAVCSGGLTWPY